MLSSLDVKFVSAEDLQGTPGRSLERPGCSGLHEVMLEMMLLILISCILHYTILLVGAGRLDLLAIRAPYYSIVYYTILDYRMFHVDGT